MLSWLSLAFIGLALSVFGWGTGYKLSLYYPPNSSAHLMPHAKLLSKNEQDAAKNETQTKPSKKNAFDKDRAESAVSLFLMFVLAVAVRYRLPALSQRECEASRLLYRRRRASLNFFFLLPPPVRL
jgi:hypothetical protein